MPVVGASRSLLCVRAKVASPIRQPSPSPGGANPQCHGRAGSSRLRRSTSENRRACGPGSRHRRQAGQGRSPAGCSALHRRRLPRRMSSSRHPPESASFYSSVAVADNPGPAQDEPGLGYAQRRPRVRSSARPARLRWCRRSRSQPPGPRRASAASRRSCRNHSNFPSGGPTEVKLGTGSWLFRGPADSRFPSGSDLHPARQSHEAALRRCHRCMCRAGTQIEHVDDRTSDVFLPR
jgi:hypothetical protein